MAECSLTGYIYVYIFTQHFRDASLLLQRAPVHPLSLLRGFPLCAICYTLSILLKVDFWFVP